MPIRATRNAHRQRAWWRTPPQQPPWHTRSGCWDTWRHCGTSSTEQTDCWLSCLELREAQVFRWDKLDICEMINVHSVLIRFKIAGTVAVWCTPKHHHLWHRTNVRVHKGGGSNKSGKWLRYHRHLMFLVFCPLFYIHFFVFTYRHTYQKELLLFAKPPQYLPPLFSGHPVALC